MNKIEPILIEAVQIRSKVFETIQQYVPLDCILDDFSDPINIGKEAIQLEVDIVISDYLREIRND